MKISWLLLSWTCPSVLQPLPDPKARPCLSPPLFPSPWQEPAGTVWICSIPPTHPDFQSDIPVSPHGLQLRKNKVDFALSEGRGCVAVWSCELPGRRSQREEHQVPLGITPRGAFPQREAHTLHLFETISLHLSLVFTWGTARPRSPHSCTIPILSASPLILSSSVPNRETS